MQPAEFPKGVLFSLKSEISSQSGSVISKTILNKKSGTVTLFYFDQGQGLSEHTAPFDAMVQCIEGKMTAIIGGKEHVLSEGESIIMPANIPHAIKALAAFKMLLIMIKSTE